MSTDRPPDGPYGAGWSDRGVDWGASSDRKPRLKPTRNLAIIFAVGTAIGVLIVLPRWLEGDFRLGQLAIPGVQLLASVRFYSMYRQLLRDRGTA